MHSYLLRSTWNLKAWAGCGILNCVRQGVYTRWFWASESSELQSALCMIQEALISNFWLSEWIHTPSVLFPSSCLPGCQQGWFPSSGSRRGCHCFDGHRFTGPDTWHHWVHFMPLRGSFSAVFSSGTVWVLWGRVSETTGAGTRARAPPTSQQPFAASLGPLSRGWPREQKATSSPAPLRPRSLSFLTGYKIYLVLLADSLSRYPAWLVVRGFFAFYVGV